METLKHKWNNLSIRRFFIFSVLITIIIVLFLSGLTIGGCLSLRHRLLPDSNSAYLTVEQTFGNGTVSSTHRIEFNGETVELPSLVTSELENDIVLNSKYAIKKIENSYDSLTPKRKIAYTGCGVIMVAFPFLFSVSGILFCGLYFYKRKLSEPIRLLSNAAAQIAAQNLDFSLEYPYEDEMGNLCQSFENMRLALYENNKLLWNMLEEQRLLHASVAHDLRNPIAIIEGYAEYLQINLPKGTLSVEQIASISCHLSMAAKRLEHYTDSIRTLSGLEDLKIIPKELSLRTLAEEITEDFSVIAEQNHLRLTSEHSLPDSTVLIDNTVLYRILENIFGNALRFAKNCIHISFSVTYPSENNVIANQPEQSKKGILHITIMDDGPGFSDEILRKKGKTNIRSDISPVLREDGHMGMGLNISLLLSKKLGGSLILNNREDGGAAVTITCTLKS